MVYEHVRCKKKTQMPEKIVRSYLVKPNLYNDKTYCVGCKGYIKTNTVKWVETNEYLDDYFVRLAEKFEKGKNPADFAKI